MGLSRKQVRYLYAIGMFGKSKTRFAKKKSLTGTNLQALREVGRVGASLKVGEVSQTHHLKIGDQHYPLQKDKNESTYPVVNGKKTGAKDLPKGEMSLVRIQSLHAKKSSGQKSQGPKTQEEHARHWDSLFHNLEKKYDMSTDEGKAIWSYVGSGQSINKSLRKGDTEWFQQKIDQIDSLFKSESIELPKPLKVSRNIQGEFAKTLSETPVGTHITDQGYTSTTLRESGVFTGYSHTVTIDLPKGTRVLGINRNQQELLLPRGSSFVKTGQSGTEIRLKYVTQSNAETGTSTRTTDKTDYTLPTTQKDFSEAVKRDGLKHDELTKPLGDPLEHLPVRQQMEAQEAFGNYQGVVGYQYTNDTLRGLGEKLFKTN